MNIHIFKNKTKCYGNDSIFSYCGQCLSNNILKDDNGYFLLDKNKKCKCLDCGWTGTKYECKNMTLDEQEKLN